MTELRIPAPVTEFAYGRLLNPDGNPYGLSLTPEGHLLVTVRGEVMTRTEPLLVASDNLEQRALNRRMQGRAVPEVFTRLSALAGDGTMVIGCEGERFEVLRLDRDLCFVVERYLWALESSLMWDVGMVPGSRHHAPLSLVRMAGEGCLALRVPGELVAVKISHGCAHRVDVASFVGWVGAVVPFVEGDYLRCEGDGAVFVSLPLGHGARPSGESAA